MSRFLISIAMIFGVGGLHFLFDKGFAERWVEIQTRNHRTLFTSVGQIRAFGVALLALAAMLGWYGYLVR
jgi:hypothetical protein